MKKLFVLAIAGSAFAVSCTQKGVADGKITKAESISQGKVIFENSCGKCHDLPNPKSHTDAQWTGIVNTMAPKAKLTDAQGTMVYDYVTANN